MPDDLAALLATLKPGLTMAPLDCNTSCFDGECSCSGEGVVAAYDADPVAVLAQACLDAETALAEAVDCYDAICEAERQDAAVGYPMPGDSCLAATLGLRVDEAFAERIRPALVALRAATGNNAGGDT